MALYVINLMLIQTLSIYVREIILSNTSRTLFHYVVITFYDFISFEIFFNQSTPSANILNTFLNHPQSTD